MTDLWSLVSGLWSLVFGLRSLAFGLWLVHLPGGGVVGTRRAPMNRGKNSKAAATAVSSKISSCRRASRAHKTHRRSRGANGAAGPHTGSRAFPLRKRGPRSKSFKLLIWFSPAPFCLADSECALMPYSKSCSRHTRIATCSLYQPRAARRRQRSASGKQQNPGPSPEYARWS